MACLTFLLIFFVVGYILYALGCVWRESTSFLRRQDTKSGESNETPTIGERLDKGLPVVIVKDGHKVLLHPGDAGYEALAKFLRRRS